MFLTPRNLHFDSTITTLNRGNSNLNKEGYSFSDTGDTYHRLYFDMLVSSQNRVNCDARSLAMRINQEEPID
jgi:hypothetical protein